jgi:hypothetical protein
MNGIFRKTSRSHENFNSNRDVVNGISQMRQNNNQMIEEIF